MRKMPTYVVKITSVNQSRYCTYEIEAESIEKVAQYAISIFNSPRVDVLDLDITTMTVEEVDFTRGQSLTPLERWDYTSSIHEYQKYLKLKSEDDGTLTNDEYDRLQELKTIFEGEN
jgi:hypothetical protein